MFHNKTTSKDIPQSTILGIVNFRSRVSDITLLCMPIPILSTKTIYVIIRQMGQSIGVINSTNYDQQIRCMSWSHPAILCEFMVHDVPTDDTSKTRLNICFCYTIICWCFIYIYSHIFCKIFDFSFIEFIFILFSFKYKHGIYYELLHNIFYELFTIYFLCVPQSFY